MTKQETVGHTQGLPPDGIKRAKCMACGSEAISIKTTGELIALRAQNAELLEVLSRYVAAYPAFRSKPEGAPGSAVRIEQERLMALEDSVNAVLSKGRK